MLTIGDLEKLANSIYEATGDEWLDNLFSLDGRPYYRYLYRLAKKVNPDVIVELGVQTGRSTAHLAKGAPKARVIGIDPQPWDLTEIQKECPNIEIIVDYSERVDISDFPEVDILFIDSAHTHDQVMTEFNMYSQLVRRGGVILLDDINLPDGHGESKDMRKAWDAMPEPKLELNFLHGHGFGVIVV